MTTQSTFDYVPDEPEKKSKEEALNVLEDISKASIERSRKRSAESAKKQEVIAPETALAIIEIKSDNALTVFTGENGLDPYLTELEARARAAIEGYDITTIAGQDGIRSVAYSLSKSKKPLENLAAGLKKASDDLIDKVNAERNRGIKFIDDLQKELRRPLTEYEEKEKSRIGVHNARLDVLRAMIAFEGEPTAAAVQERINGMEQFNNVNWQEFTESAKATREKVEAQLSSMLVTIKKAEDDAAELAIFRQKQEEENARGQKIYDEAHTDNVAFDAAAKATKDAEEEAERQRVAREAEVQKEQDAAAERERLANERAEKAEKDRKDAHFQAMFQLAEMIKVPAEAPAAIIQSRLDTLKVIHQRDWQEFAPEAQEIFTVGSKNLGILHGKAVKAEADKKAKEDKAALDKVLQDALDLAAAEKKKDDDAKALREADKTHRAKINNAALAAIKALPSMALVPDATIQEIIVAIAKNQIPNITIKY